MPLAPAAKAVIILTPMLIAAGYAFYEQNEPFRDWADDKWRRWQEFTEDQGWRQPERQAHAHGTASGAQRRPRPGWARRARSSQNRDSGVELAEHLVSGTDIGAQDGLRRRQQGDESVAGRGSGLLFDNQEGDDTVPSSSHYELARTGESSVDVSVPEYKSLPLDRTNASESRSLQSGRPAALDTSRSAHGFISDDDSSLADGDGGRTPLTPGSEISDIFPSQAELDAMETRSDTTETVSHVSEEPDLEMISARSDFSGHEGDRDDVVSIASSGWSEVGSEVSLDSH